jgi:hypothetical protein
MDRDMTAVPDLNRQMLSAVKSERADIWVLPRKEILLTLVVLGCQAVAKLRGGWCLQLRAGDEERGRSSATRELLCWLRVNYAFTARTRIHYKKVPEIPVLTIHCNSLALRTSP